MARPVLRRYWSGIKNVRARLIRDDSVGRNARKEYFERTKLKKFRERNYQRRLSRGQTYTLLETRRAWAKIRNKRDERLRKEHKRLKKQGKDVGNFKEFKRTNEPDDFNAVQELFNSP